MEYLVSVEAFWNVCLNWLELILNYLLFLLVLLFLSLLLSKFLQIFMRQNFEITFIVLTLKQTPDQLVFQCLRQIVIDKEWRIDQPERSFNFLNIFFRRQHLTYTLLPIILQPHFISLVHLLYDLLLWQA